MKKIFLGLLLISLYFQVKSQVMDTFPWCPPGATWLYKSFSATERLYFKFSYEKDTSFNNLNVKKINVEAIQIIGLGNVTTRTIKAIDQEYLYQKFDSVYWFDKVNNNFKVLYSFTPKLNDEFIINNSRVVCSSDPNFVKIDTIKVNKISKDTFNNLIFNSFETDRTKRLVFGKILQNIGSLESPFPQINRKYCNFSKSEYGDFYERLICYSDSFRGTLIFSSQGKEECHFVKTFVNNAVKKSDPSKTRLFPNPANSFIKIENTGNNNYHSLLICNYLGQQVIEQKYYKETIDVSTLKRGFYFMKLFYASGITETIKFLKD